MSKKLWSILIVCDDFADIRGLLAARSSSARVLHKGPTRQDMHHREHPKVSGFALISSE
jgi:hypothetical protein